MMARPRGRILTRGGRKNRQTTWVAPADQNTVSVASGASVIIGSFAPDDAGMLHPTIVRVRGEVSIRPNSFGADVAISGAFGMAIVSDDAFAAGTASIPRPFDDAEWGGWFVWQSFSNHVESIDQTGVVFPGSISYQVDSKAMRKVGENETMVLMCESQSGAIEIAMHVRTLFLLS